MADRVRIAWVHPQPEHYFNVMLDDLNRAGERNGGYEYQAVFLYKGTGMYAELPLPKAGPKPVLLRPRPGMPERYPRPLEHYHLDWKADVAGLGFSAAIISGYMGRTEREMFRWLKREGIPTAMFSDSNMRSQMGKSLKDRAKRAVKKVMLSRIIGQTDVLLTANRLGVEYWKYYGAPAEKVVVCPYYADYGRVETARQTDRAAVLGRIGLKVEDRVIFSAARLVPAKALDLMIRAFLASGFGKKGYRYVIAGVGPLEKELKELCGEELGKTILFIGFQQPSEALALMHHADVFVLPSVYEPHGIVVQESLAGGTPVIASDVVGAAYDLVEAGVNGEIFRSGDWKDLQRKLEAVLGDAKKLAEMRKASREKFDAWLAEFSPIVVVERVARELLGRCQKPEAGSQKKRGGR